MRVITIAAVFSAVASGCSDAPSLDPASPAPDARDAGFFHPDALSRTLPGPVLGEPGTIALPRGGSLAVDKQQQPEDGPDATASWSERFVLTLRDDGEQAGFTFDASYGIFEAIALDITGDGLEEVALVRASGRGTAATSYVLEILQLQDGVPVSVFQAMVGGVLFGPPSNDEEPPYLGWRRLVRPVPRPAGGFDLCLELVAEPHVAQRFSRLDDLLVLAAGDVLLTYQDPRGFEIREIQPAAKR